MSDPTERTRCVGTAKSTGERCKLDAIPGGTVCARFHGGKAPQVMRAAERRLEEARVQREVDRLGLSVETTASAALQDALNRAQADVIALGAKTALLAPEEWVERESLAGGGSRREVSPWLRAYWNSLDRLAGIASKCVSLGIEAAAVSVLASHADELVRVLSQVLRALGHDPAEPLVVDVVTRALRSVEGEIA